MHLLGNTNLKGLEYGTALLPSKGKESVSLSGTLTKKIFSDINWACHQQTFPQQPVAYLVQTKQGEDVFCQQNHLGFFFMLVEKSVPVIHQSIRLLVTGFCYSLSLPLILDIWERQNTQWAPERQNLHHTHLWNEYIYFWIYRDIMKMFYFSKLNKIWFPFYFSWHCILTNFVKHIWIIWWWCL